jgi:hypothetical protein
MANRESALIPKRLPKTSCWTIKLSIEKSTRNALNARNMSNLLTSLGFCPLLNPLLFETNNLAAGIQGCTHFALVLSEPIPRVPTPAEDRT